jgi:hypothetical protein
MATEVIVDLTNYKDRVGSRLTPGRYTVTVEDVELDKSKAGNPMVNVWYRVLGGEHEGATVIDRLTLTEKAMFRVVGFMQALGFPTPRKRLKLDVEKFVGRKLQIDVEDGDPYNGRVKSEVRGYLKFNPDSKDTNGNGDAPADLPDADESDTPASEDAESVEESSPEEVTASAEAPEAPEEIDLDEIDIS